MITKILVANRGEIARRVFRTCREMGISTVAIYSEPDLGEPHMREADEAVPLTGASPADTYLDIEAVLAAAKETGADAIHPGYGFLSENARFAAAVTEAGITWIGPTPQSIEIMGSKLASKRLMDSAGVANLPSIELDDGRALADAAESIGLPLLVKASAGGGGKGMRVVRTAADLASAVESARREAAGAFGDDTVFLEKYLEAPRHIEIQVLGDSHGGVISLHERECSIQRRHQKIVEESPSPALTREKSRLMSEAAIAAARAVDYVGAGTVEFLYQDEEFYFLEMNTRLQVEHPVTEMVTGLDLVRLQIEIASGGHVPQDQPVIGGHAIEARLYTEDPLNGFLPVTGEIHSFHIPRTPGLRVDSGVEDGSHVTVHYDPMIAKVIAHASNRDTAASLLASTLRRAQIHGPITNRAVLVRVLEHPEFLAGDTDTHFLDRHDPTVLGTPLIDSIDERAAAAAAALSDQALERQAAGQLRSIGAGWRNSPSQLQHRAYTGDYGTHDIWYTVDPGGFGVEGVGHIALHAASESAVTLTVDGTEHHFMVSRHDRRRFVDSEAGPAELIAEPRFPSIESDEEAGSLHAPMPGKVIKVEVNAGDLVEEGQVLVVLEAMKMEHSLRSPHSGRVAAIHHVEGDQVEADAVLVVVEEI